MLAVTVGGAASPMTVIVSVVLITLSPVVVFTPVTFTVYVPAGTVVPSVYVPSHIFGFGSVTPGLLYSCFTRLPPASSILMVALTRSENSTLMLVVCGGVMVVFVMVYATSVGGSYVSPIVTLTSPSMSRFVPATLVPYTPENEYIPSASVGTVTLYVNTAPSGGKLPNRLIFSHVILPDVVFKVPASDASTIFHPSGTVSVMTSLFTAATSSKSIVKLTVMLSSGDAVAGSVRVTVSVATAVDTPSNNITNTSPIVVCFIILYLL